MQDFPAIAVLEFDGPDAQGFLHRQLSADLTGLTVGASRFACLCDLKGRVLAMLLVQVRAGGCLVACHAELADQAAAHLSRYILRDKVRIRRREDLQLRVMLPEELPTEASESCEPLPGLRYRWQTALVESPAAERQADELAHELEMGLCWLDRTSSARFLPQMLAAEALGALSFRKGCYPGQEVVARMHFLGKQKQHAWTGRIRGELDARGMTPVSLLGGGIAADGMLLAAARKSNDENASGETQVFTVVRAGAAFAPVTLHCQGRELAVASGRWLAPELFPEGAAQA